jgi:NADPH:quinone reductase-like Zn-dependent oxidoreductase
MKAVQINEYGSRLNLRAVEIAKPGFGANQLLIRIKASSVNPIDIKIRAGMMAEAMPKTFPLILGWEGAGIVEQVGADASRFSKGDEVYFMPNFGQGGTYAAYVAVNENEVARKPATLSYLQSSAIPMVAGAAYASIIKDADLQAGQKILIHGAAGAVGSYAVQLAKQRGAYVIGTAAGEGLDLLRSLGVDEVIDYTSTDFTTIGKDLDVVLDLVGGETLSKSFSILKKGGLLLSTVMPPSAAQAKEAGVRIHMVFTQPDAVMLADIARLIDSGKLKTREPVVMSLDEAQQAHEMIENRTAKGKLVFAIE